MNPMKILVVDDDRDFGEGLVDILQILGYRTALAHSYDDGIGIAGESAFDVALVDIGLGDRNGADCAREIQRTRAETSCILVTGYSNDTLAERSIDTGDFEVLVKPVRVADLERLLTSNPA